MRAAAVRPCPMILAFLLACPASIWAGTSNSLMDISSDGQLLACSNRDSGTVTIVDLPAHSKLCEIPVGEQPEGVSFVGDTHVVAVAVYADDLIAWLDADRGEQLAATEVFDEPYAVVSDPDGKYIYVTLDYPGQILQIHATTHQITRTLQAGSHLRGMAIAPAEKRLYVTEYYTAQVKAIDLGTHCVVDQWPAAGTDNLCRQIVLNPRRPKAYLPHIRSRVTAVHGAGSIFPYVSVVDTVPGDTVRNEQRRRKRIPMDSFLGNRVTANPWEAAISPDGRQFYVVFGGTNDMFACQVIDDDYREIGEPRHLRTGANPRAVRLSPDGNTLYVYNALDFEVTARTATDLRLTHRISVTDNPLADDVLLGKRLFYSAQQPMVGRRWISCSSCHPDGEPDRRTWHNPEGLRNTQSLAGMAWTHPIHWSADRDEVQDFEHTIRGPLMQGRGLIRQQVQPALGQPNRGLSAELDALARYSNSHEFTLSPHAKQGLSTSARRGRELFFSAQTGCSTCHAGPFYTDSRPRPVDQIIRHDVGTGEDDPREKMGPAYDTPTLLGVYRTAPYLHHGKANTLQEVLTTCNPNDRHGKTSHLDKQQIEDLVEFLKALPYEDPREAARQQGLTRIER